MVNITVWQFECSTIGIPKQFQRISMYRIVFPDGTFRTAHSIAERNAVIAEMKEAYADYYK
jgi:hypothetical protein